MKTLTSNQHYGGLNRRFDKRAKRLARMGYTYERTDELGQAFFIPPVLNWRRRYTTAIPACFVHAADNRTFWEMVKGND